MSGPNFMDDLFGFLGSRQACPRCGASACGANPLIRRSHTAYRCGSIQWTDGGFSQSQTCRAAEAAIAHGLPLRQHPMDRRRFQPITNMQGRRGGEGSK